MRPVFSLAAATGVVTGVTVAQRLGAVSLGPFASTPRAIADGRVWLLATSALVADRPAVPSVVGFALVGLAALLLAGARVLWTAAAVGHVFSTLAVYGLLHELVHPVTRPDYGTSAIIAAWIGVIACVLWRRGRPTVGVALCIVSALVAWIFRPGLDLLDTEHLVALALGVAIAAPRPRLRAPAAMHALVLRPLLRRGRLSAARAVGRGA
jgi:hypothetical protein